MSQNPPCSVIEVQRLNGDLIVIFNDNRCGVYPAHMLYELLSAVEVMDSYESDEEFACFPTEELGRDLTNSPE